MRRILERYLAVHFIIPFVIAMLFFVVFLLTFQLFRIIKMVISKGVEWSAILSIVVDIAISFLPMAIPLSCFFAVIYIMGKMSEDSEIVAMRSFGMTKNQIFRPFLLLGALIAVTIFVLNANIVPLAKKEFTNTTIRLTSRGMLNDIRAGRFFMDIPGVTLFVEKYKEEQMQGIMIQSYGRVNDEERIIFAKTGILVKEDIKHEWDIPRLRMHLSNGNIVKINNERQRMEKILFQEYDFPLMETEAPGFITKDSMRTNRELFSILKKGPAEGKKDRSFIKSELELGERIKTPLECILFILLGFCLGIKKARGRAKDKGIMILGVLALYYTFYFVGVTFAQKGTLHPYLVSVLPFIIFMVLGLKFYRRLDWPN
jgi:lipopolysaccharide export system permease protein